MGSTVPLGRTNCYAPSDLETPSQEPPLGQDRPSPLPGLGTNTALPKEAHPRGTRKEAAVNATLEKITWLEQLLKVPKDNSEDEEKPTKLLPEELLQPTIALMDGGKDEQKPAKSSVES